MKSRMDMAEKIEKLIPFVDRTGLRVLDIRSRYVKVLMPFSGNQNHLGTMYAGAIFTAAEIPGGALCFATFDMDRFYPVAKEFSIRYWKPVLSDITMELAWSEEEASRIQADAEKEGKGEFVVEADLLDREGEAVASIRGVYQLRSKDFDGWAEGKGGD